MIRHGGLTIAEKYERNRAAATRKKTVKRPKETPLTKSQQRKVQQLREKLAEQHSKQIQNGYNIPGAEVR